MESENTPESDDEELFIPETDYSRQEDRDDLYGGDGEYDIVYDLDGNISEPAPIDWPTGMDAGFS